MCYRAGWVFSVHYTRCHSQYWAVSNSKNRTEKSVEMKAQRQITKRFPKITRKANTVVCCFFLSSPRFFFSTHIEYGVSVCLAFFHIFSSFSSVRFYSFFYYFSNRNNFKIFEHAAACSPIFNSITLCRHNIIAFLVLVCFRFVSFKLMRLAFFLLHYSLSLLLLLFLLLHITYSK